MAILLNILLETLLLMGFLWIGKSIMKAQIYFKTLLIAALAGACASQVPFVGTYLSFAVVLFFMWKMARIDMVPDGALIVIIGKGVSFILMIYIAGMIWDRSSVDIDALAEEIPIYEDEDGIQYFAEDEKVYYTDAEGEKVYVDANVLFGFSEGIVENAGESAPEPVEPAATQVVQEEPSASVEVAVEDLAAGYSEPYLSDLMVRGEAIPYLMFVPQGWMVKHSEGTMTLRLQDHDFIRCLATDEISDNKAYLRKEVNRVLSQYSGYEIARQEIIKMDRKQWARIQFANSSGDQVLLITHGGNFGCYSIELNGSFKQLSAHKETLNRVITSFKFPASTYFVAKAEAEENL